MQYSGKPSIRGLLLVLGLFYVSSLDDSVVCYSCTVRSGVEARNRLQAVGRCARMLHDHHLQIMPRDLLVGASRRTDWCSTANTGGVQAFCMDGLEVAHVAVYSTIRGQSPHPRQATGRACLGSPIPRQPMPFLVLRPCFFFVFLVNPVASSARWICNRIRKWLYQCAHAFVHALWSCTKRYHGCLVQDAAVKLPWRRTLPDSG
jgi:hypothetical protein